MKTNKIRIKLITYIAVCAVLFSGLMGNAGKVNAAGIAAVTVYDGGWLTVSAGGVFTAGNASEVSGTLSDGAAVKGMGDITVTVNGNQKMSLIDTDGKLLLNGTGEITLDTAGDYGIKAGKGIDISGVRVICNDKKYGIYSQTGDINVTGGSNVTVNADPAGSGGVTTKGSIIVNNGEITTFNKSVYATNEIIAENGKITSDTSNGSGYAIRADQDIIAKNGGILDGKSKIDGISTTYGKVIAENGGKMIGWGKNCGVGAVGASQEIAPIIVKEGGVIEGTGERLGVSSVGGIYVEGMLTGIATGPDTQVFGVINWAGTGTEEIKASGNGKITGRSQGSNQSDCGILAINSKITALDHGVIEGVGNMTGMNAPLGISQSGNSTITGAGNTLAGIKSNAVTQTGGVMTGTGKTMGITSAKITASSGARMKGISTGDQQDYGVYSSNTIAASDSASIEGNAFYYGVYAVGTISGDTLSKITGNAKDRQLIGSQKIASVMGGTISIAGDAQVIENYENPVMTIGENGGKPYEILNPGKNMTSCLNYQWSASGNISLINDRENELIKSPVTADSVLLTAVRSYNDSVTGEVINIDGSGGKHIINMPGVLKGTKYFYRIEYRDKQTDAEIDPISYPAGSGEGLAGENVYVADNSVNIAGYTIDSGNPEYFVISDNEQNNTFVIYYSETVIPIETSTPTEEVTPAETPTSTETVTATPEGETTIPIITATPADTEGNGTTSSPTPTETAVPEEETTIPVITNTPLDTGGNGATSSPTEDITAIPTVTATSKIRETGRPTNIRVLPTDTPDNRRKGTGDDGNPDTGDHSVMIPAAIFALSVIFILGLRQRRKDIPKQGNK